MSSISMGRCNYRLLNTIPISEQILAILKSTGGDFEPKQLIHTVIPHDNRKKKYAKDKKEKGRWNKDPESLNND